MTLLLACLLIVLFSWGLTWVVKHYAEGKQLFDTPNDRSSHTIPTPRGGGLAMVVAFLSVLAAMYLTELLPINNLAALMGAGLLIAVIGFRDDHSHIAARWRLLFHFLAAAWGLYFLNGLPPLLLFGEQVDLGWFAQICTLLFIVWMINLYNFMDGIDGIASVEAITVCLSGAGLVWLIDPAATTGLLAILFAAATIGFLVWNFPPAKIFMGDVGSGFIGIMIALFTIQASWVAPQLLWSWLILLGVFMVDATVTLFRRVCRKEKFYQAHCSHAYQHAARVLGSHRMVTLAVLAINIVWLLPIATLVAIQQLDGIVGLVLAYLPLLWLSYYFKAGDSQAQTIME